MELVLYTSIVGIASCVAVWSVFVYSRVRQLKFFSFFSLYIFWREAVRDVVAFRYVFSRNIMYEVWSRYSEAAGNVLFFIYKKMLEQYSCPRCQRRRFLFYYKSHTEAIDNSWELCGLALMLRSRGVHTSVLGVRLLRFTTWWWPNEEGRNIVTFKNYSL
jgi:hypothetical protein